MLQTFCANSQRHFTSSTLPATDTFKPMIWQSYSAKQSMNPGRPPISIKRIRIGISLNALSFKIPSQVGLQRDFMFSEPSVLLSVSFGESSLCTGTLGCTPRGIRVMRILSRMTRFRPLSTLLSCLVPSEDFQNLPKIGKKQESLKVIST